MPNYAAMYKVLFNSVSDAIEILQKAQQTTEEMYISTPDPDIWVLDTNKQVDDSDNADQE